MDPSEEREPDYRMTLAAERTYLAYVRTGLALLAAGVAVVGALPDLGAIALRRVLGLGLVIIGGAVLALARPRWRAIDQAIRRGEPLPAPRVALLGWLLILAAVGAAILVLTV